MSATGPGAGSRGRGSEGRSRASAWGNRAASPNWRRIARSGTSTRWGCGTIPLAAGGPRRDGVAARAAPRLAVNHGAAEVGSGESGPTRRPATDSMDGRC